MSALTFAPGPWTAVANSWQRTTVYDSKQMPVCRLDLEDWGVDEDNQFQLEHEQTKVARLISQAPALLEAAQEFVKWAEVAGMKPQPGSSVAKALDAIRNATGKEA